jgi:hypothetical protein
VLKNNEPAGFVTCVPMLNQAVLRSSWCVPYRQNVNRGVLSLTIQKFPISSFGEYMRKWIALVVVITLSHGRVVLAQPRKAANSVTAESAINLARETLYGLQKNGNWENAKAPDADKSAMSTENGQWGGLTALATYALLAAGESYDDPRIKAALDWLKAADMKGVYALSLRAQVWSLLPAKDTLPLLRRDAGLLLQGVRSKGADLGFYSYLIAPGGSSDHCVSHFGVMGTNSAAEFAPNSIPREYWRIVEQAWLRDQSNGGWAYAKTNRVSENATLSMTAAGVSCLLATQDFNHASDGVDCQGNIHYPALDAGITWLADYFQGKGPIANSTFTWYSVARAGSDNGLKYFGTIDWREAGYNQILPIAGQWNEHGPVTGTSFALLFLLTGEAPVAINKLAYEFATVGVEPHWNERPRDIANITKSIALDAARLLNWRLATFDKPADWTAPILYLSGNQRLDFKKEDEEKLRIYVEHGGLLVFNADAGSANFTNSILGAAGKPGLAARLFPELSPRKIPNDHPIFNKVHHRKGPQDFPDVTAVGDGKREFMVVLANGDPARSWQTRTAASHEFNMHIMTNIYTICTERLPKPAVTANPRIR